MGRALRDHQLASGRRRRCRRRPPTASATASSTSYVLPFELASIVLLAALIGAVVLSRKELKGERA